MDEHFEWLEKEIPEWQKKSLIDADSAQKILNFYREKKAAADEVYSKINEGLDWENDKEDKESSSSSEKPLTASDKKPLQAPLILSVIAAIFIGGGIISLIAYNWHAISRFIKTIGALVITLLPALALVPLLLKSKKKLFTKKSYLEFISSLWTILFGASIEFLSQIYMIPLSWQTLFLLWTLGACLIMLATRSLSSSILSLILYIAYAFSEESVFLFIPLVTGLFFYGQKRFSIKKDWIAGLTKYGSLYLLFMTFLFLLNRDFWFCQLTVSENLVYICSTLISFAFPLYYSVKEKKYSHSLILLVYPLLITVFHFVYYYIPVDEFSLNVQIVLFLISLIFTCYSAFFLNKVFFYVTSAFSFILLLINYWNFYVLSLVVFAFLFFILLLWRYFYRQEKKIQLPCIVLYSILGLGYLLMVFRNEQSIIAKVTDTSMPIFQNILLVIMILAAFLMLGLLLKNIFSDKGIYFKSLEFFILLLLFTLYLSLSYINYIPLDLVGPVAKVLVMTSGLYAAFKLIRFKDYSFIAFVVSFIFTLLFDLNIVITNLPLLFLMLNFLLAILAIFIQSFKKESNKIVGKILFALSAFLMIFQNFEYDLKVFAYPEWLNKTIFLMEYNLLFVYLFALVSLRSFLKSFYKKESINYAEYVYSFLLFLVLMMVQFSFTKTILPGLTNYLPMICLILVLLFAIFEIVYWLKRNSIAGINVTACYILFVACVKFFTATNSLIARGIAFILCGIILLVTNLLLSKYLKKEAKNEK